MKLTQEFVLRKIAGDNILIPVVGIDDNFQGIINLNDTGAFIWEKIAAGLEQEQIVDALLEEYEVTAEHAARNVADLCDHLKQLGILA